MKSEVYSWRVSRGLKGELKDAAREGRVSMAELLERIAREWLDEYRAAAADDEAEQSCLRAAAAPFIGCLRGNDPERAEKAGERVREILRRKYGR